MLGLIVLAGCASWEAAPGFVLPASFTDRVCGRYALERGQDAALMGHPQAIQVRVASDVYSGCVKERRAGPAP